MRTVVLALVAAMAGCSDGPLDPQLEPENLKPQLAVTSGPWTEDPHAMSGWNGVSVWRRSDPRVVIGFGKEMAKYASYLGTDYKKSTIQRQMFEDLERAVGTGLKTELNNREVIDTFRRVRNGKDVGLWVLVYPPGWYGFTNWKVMAVAQRPRGSNSVPWN